MAPTLLHPTTEAADFLHREHVDVEEIDEVRFWSGRVDPKDDLDDLDNYVADDEYDRDVCIAFLSSAFVQS